MNFLRIFLLLSIFICSIQGIAQSPDQEFVAKSYNAMKSKCQNCSEYKQFGNFACYKKRVISMNFVANKVPVGTKSIGVEKLLNQNYEQPKQGVKYITADDKVYAPFLRGYNFATMNPYKISKHGNVTQDIFQAPRKNITSLNAISQITGELSKIPRMLTFKEETSKKAEGRVEIIESSKDWSSTTGVSISGEYGNELSSFAFSASGSFAETASSLKKSKSVIAVNSKVATVGTYNLTDFVIPTNTFLRDLSNLPTTYQKDAYDQFFTKYGTHYTPEVTVGAKSTTGKKYNSLEIKNCIQQNYDGKMAFSKAAVSASIEANYERKNSEERKKTSISSVSQTVGNLNNPTFINAEPIKLSLRPIYELIYVMYRGNEANTRIVAMKKAHKMYCDAIKLRAKKKGWFSEYINISDFVITAKDYNTVITDIYLDLDGKSKDGWWFIDQDLNADAGGLTLGLNYLSTPINQLKDRDRVLIDVIVTSASSENSARKIPYEWKKKYQYEYEYSFKSVGDLNNGAEGDYTYMHCLYLRWGSAKNLQIINALSTYNYKDSYWGLKWNNREQQTKWRYNPNKPHSNSLQSNKFYYWEDPTNVNPKGKTIKIQKGIDIGLMPAN